METLIRVLYYFNIHFRGFYPTMMLSFETLQVIDLKYFLQIRTKQWEISEVFDFNNK